MSGGSEPWRLSAVEAVELLRNGEVSPLELVETAAARIAATDTHLNALPTLCVDRAREHAKHIMDEGATDGAAHRWLGGLPVAIKDLTPVKGVRTTWGSPLYADHVPSRSDILVERLEANGAIVIAKSNTPEFGAGANTFNEVFGATRNPWNTAKTCGGSSGGSAVALATGQAWLAQGSDLGGSLRIPAAYCAVTGLRPSPGRVPHGPEQMPFVTLPVDGPMGRSALDVALLLDAMVGEHAEDPLALSAPERPFVEAVREKRPPKRIAYSPNLGLFPVESEIADVCAGAARRFEDLGAVVEEACPDMRDSVEIFQTLRAAYFAGMRAEMLRRHRDKLKPEIIWNIEKGLALTAEEIGRAEIARGKLYQRVAKFFRTYDLLLCPTVIASPFDVEIRYLDEVAGHRFDNYIDWLGITFVLTLTACPAASSPAGFTSDGLPIGLQIMGPPRAEAEVLTAAALLEDLTGSMVRLPIDPIGPDGKLLPPA